MTPSDKPNKALQDKAKLISLIELWITKLRLDKATIAQTSAVIYTIAERHFKPVAGDVQASLEKALINISGGLCYTTAEAKHAQLKDAEKNVKAAIAALRTENTKTDPYRDAEGSAMSGSAYGNGGESQDAALLNPDKPAAVKQDGDAWDVNTPGDYTNLCFGCGKKYQGIKNRKHCHECGSVAALLAEIEKLKDYGDATDPDYKFIMRRDIVAIVKRRAGKGEI